MHTRCDFYERAIGFTFSDRTEVNRSHQRGFHKRILWVRQKYPARNTHPLPIRIDADDSDINFFPNPQCLHRFDTGPVDFLSIKQGHDPSTKFYQHAVIYASNNRGFGFLTNMVVLEHGLPRV